jgi:hypothetical protein
MTFLVRQNDGALNFSKKIIFLCLLKTVLVFSKRYIYEVNMQHAYQKYRIRATFCPFHFIFMPAKVGTLRLGCHSNNIILYYNNIILQLFLVVCVG